MKRNIKQFVKRILRVKYPPLKFFQYEYTPQQLKQFCEQQGFYVSRAEGCDLLYPFNEIGSFSGKNLTPGSFAYRFSEKFENTWVKNFGGQSISISVKKAPIMHCFLTGELDATKGSLEKYDVPVSKKKDGTELSKCYRKNKSVCYACNYSINPPKIVSKVRKCCFTGENYTTDSIFEDYGFTLNISPKSLVRPEISMKCCTKHVKPVWRNRKV